MRPPLQFKVRLSSITIYRPWPWHLTFWLLKLIVTEQDQRSLKFVWHDPRADPWLQIRVEGASTVGCPSRPFPSLPSHLLAPILSRFPVFCRPASILFPLFLSSAPPSPVLSPMQLGVGSAVSSPASNKRFLVHFELKIAVVSWHCWYYLHKASYTPPVPPL